MTDEQKQTLFRLQAQAQDLLSQIDSIWETAVQITGEPGDSYEDALCTHDFIWNGSRNPEEDFELLQRVMARKYGKD